ncbi:ADAMTS-like protein 4 isoform X2 [Brachyhypopomus gauderio]
MCGTEADKNEKSVSGRRSRQVEEEGPEGLWSPWSEWAECSQSCGVGVSERRRHCMPPPQPPLQTWNGPAYLPTGVVNHAPVISAVRPFYPSMYPDNEPPQYRPPFFSPGLPLYRNPAGGADAERPDHAVPLYRPDFTPSHRSPPLPPSSSSSSSPSLPYGQSGRASRRPANQGSARPGGGGSRRSVSTNRDASVRRSGSSIRPGQFGYGRVPFSLPLHRQNRHTRHAHLHGNATAEPEETDVSVDRTSPESEGRGTDMSVDRTSPESEGRGTDVSVDRTSPESHGRETDKDTRAGRPRERTITRRAPPPLSAPYSSPLHRPHPSQDLPTYGQPPPNPNPQPWNGLQETGAGWAPPLVSLQNYRCSGKDQEVRTCSIQPCPGSAVDPRAEQCAAFNNKEFMGRAYDWEPFTEVGVEQQCELTCRPVGFRFYVRQAERVRDGTPCVNSTSNDVCVGGHCLSEGCDGVLGSGLVHDRCGVCGGAEGSCVRVSGHFLNTSVPLGYHKLLDIPPGATAINITERHASPNYLALRSGTGQSVVNGRWAVDPPGEYQAGGTMFRYHRPRGVSQEQADERGESLTAPGPTTTVLQLYIIYHKQNPGIDYEYYIPVKQEVVREWDGGQSSPRDISSLAAVVEDPASPSLSSSSISDRWPPERSRPQSLGPNRNVRIPPRTDIPLDSKPLFVWRRGRLTECSVSCGKGSQYREIVCVNRHTDQEVHERRCDSAAKPLPEEEPCNVHPCPPFWETGSWSECSVSCGRGLQQRQLQCRRSFGNRSTMVHPQQCAGLARPNTTQACQLRVCSHWEITSNWSACSVDCGAGKRIRSIRCVSNHGNEVSEVECSSRPRPQGSEDCHMGPCVTDWYFSDWTNTCSATCGPGTQRRDVVCLRRGVLQEGGERGGCVGDRPADLTSCNRGPCGSSTLWFTSPWGQCSSPCGNGTQRRDVICVQKLGTDFTVTQASECAHLEKPSPVQPCELEACKPQWFTTEWSTCSRSCGNGVQTREVRCLTVDKKQSSACDPSSKPEQEQLCNAVPCNSFTDESCRDRRQNCVMVVQARLCVYSYYKTACCASCAQSAQRAKRH